MLSPNTSNIQIQNPETRFEISFDRSHLFGPVETFCSRTTPSNIGSVDYSLLMESNMVSNIYRAGMVPIEAIRLTEVNQDTVEYKVRAQQVISVKLNELHLADRTYNVYVENCRSENLYLRFDMIVPTTQIGRIYAAVTDSAFSRRFASDMGLIPFEDSYDALFATIINCLNRIGERDVHYDIAIHDYDIFITPITMREFDERQPAAMQSNAPDLSEPFGLKPVAVKETQPVNKLGSLLDLIPERN